MHTIQINTTVKNNGRTGTVTEANGTRSRVAWDNGSFTWVRSSRLHVPANPSVIRGEWINTPNMASHTAFRICSSPATGETWHEYQGQSKLQKTQA
jgi:hypothetical protein